LPKDNYVNLKVFAIPGREVMILVNDNRASESYKVIFGSSNFTSGVYFCRIIFSTQIASVQIII
jgi:hypothetical protein